MLKINQIIARFMGATLITLGCLSTQSALAVSAIPTSGTCGFAISGSYPFIGVQLTGFPTPTTTGTGASATQTFYPSPSGGGSLNWLGTLNFSTNTITVNIVSQVARNLNTNGVSAPTFTNTQEQVSVPFTVGLVGSDMYVLDFGSQGSINVIPVNNGNTLLMQQFVSTSAGGKSGVCQF